MRWLPLLMMVGCAVDREDWVDVPIEQAWLDRFDLTRFDLVLGVAQGDALLRFDGPEGAGAVPVHLGGGGAGIVFDLSIDPEGHDGSVEVDLSDVEDPTVGDVFGTYYGSGAGASAVVGASGRRLKNGHGAAFREDHLVLGIGLFAGLEWLVLRQGGNDGDELPEPITVPDPPLTSTGDTGDTAPLPIRDTAPALAPTPPRGCGCNGRSGDGPPDGAGDTDGTGAGDTDGTASTDPTTTTTPTGTGTGTDETAGDSGGGSSCDCGTDSGCACSQGTLAPVGLLWAGVLVRRRRRRLA